MSLATATRVNTWDSSFVSQSSGDFAAFTNFLDNATMSAPWIFNTGTPGSPLPGGPLAALWQVGGFTFDLNSSSVVLQSSTFLNVTGVGVVSGNGFDPTPGFFSFTASGDGSPQPSFSFQANSAVPEASTVGLLAVGAFGWVGIYYRRRNRRQSPATTL